jgi:hypothetical protein
MSITEYVDGIRLCCQNQPSGSSTRAAAARLTRRRKRFFDTFSFRRQVQVLQALPRRPSLPCQPPTPVRTR